MRLSSVNRELLDAFEDSIPAYLSDVTDVIVDCITNVAESNVTVMLTRGLNDLLDLSIVSNGFSFPSDRLPHTVKQAYCFAVGVCSFVESDDCDELQEALHKLTSSVELLLEKLLPHSHPLARAGVIEVLKDLADKTRMLATLQEAYENSINQPRVNIYPEGGHRGAIAAVVFPIVAGLVAGLIFTQLPVAVFVVPLAVVLATAVVLFRLYGPTYANAERRLRGLFATAASSTGSEVSELLVQLATYEIEISGVSSSEERSKLVAAKIQKMIQDLNEGNSSSAVTA